MSRPDTITLPIVPVDPGVTGPAASRELGHSLNIGLSRHPEEKDCYGVSASSGSRAQIAMLILIQYLNQNGVTPVVTKESHGKINYISAVEVKGDQDVDKLIALSERHAGAEMGHSKGSGARTR